MKVVILAGGLVTRISEETQHKPKPMVEIGGKPILLHIMSIYSRYGFRDFVICLGYKSQAVKEFFSRYYLYQSDVTFDFEHGGSMKVHRHHVQPWTVTLVDTGLETMTGGRVKRIRDFIGDETFLLTYGDGVGNVDIEKLLQFHRSHGKLATLTTTQPEGRFGALQIDEDGTVRSFTEKPRGDGNWINAGFFVLEPEVFRYLEGDQTVLEREPLENLAKDGQLAAYRHYGFWHPMDTMRDRNMLDELCKSGQPPWER